MSKLAETVREDIVAFLNSNGELLFNERDFQIHLAVWLKSNGKYCDVDVEYYVPRKELVGYVWDSELKLDIVVKKYDEYLVQVTHDFNGLREEGCRVVSSDFLELRDGGVFHDGEKVVNELLRMVYGVRNTERER